MFHASVFFSNILASHDARTVDVEGGELSLFGFGWRAALAQEMLVHFGGILKDPCLAHPSCAHPLAASREFQPERLLPLPFSSLANDDWVRSSEQRRSTGQKKSAAIPEERATREH
jgi:hypothetical protein